VQWLIAPAAINLHVSGPSKATATVVISLASREQALQMAAALAPDNDGFLTTRVEGTNLHLEATSNDAMGLLRSLDDALGCLRAAGVE
jgi:hypothetical protein